MGDDVSAAGCQLPGPFAKLPGQLSPAPPTGKQELAREIKRPISNTVDGPGGTAGHCKCELLQRGWKGAYVGAMDRTLSLRRLSSIGRKCMHGRESQARLSARDLNVP